MTIFGQGGPGMNLGSSDRPEQVKSLQASAHCFRAFGVAPLMGRTYTPAEDLPGGPKVVVIGHSPWQAHLSGDPNIIGRTIVLNAEPYTVIGVLREGFQPDPPADVFLPIQADPNSANQGHYLRIAARLKPGVSVEAARAEMKVVGERFRALHSKEIGWRDLSSYTEPSP